MIKPIRTDKYGNPNSGAVIRAINAMIEEHNVIIKALFPNISKNKQTPITRFLSRERNPNEGGPVPGDLP